MTAVVARIALRYVAAALIAKGLLAPEMGAQITNDPDLAAALQVILGLLSAGAAEGWYYLARKFGWSK